MDYKLVTTASEIADAVRELSQRPAIGFDIETTGLNSRHSNLRLLQFSDGENLHFIIDAFKLDNPDALQLLKPMLEAERPRKVIHNAKFEEHWCKTLLGIELGGVFDTYIAAKLIDMPLDCKLNDVLERFLGIEISKEEQRSDWSVPTLSKSQLEYAIRDAYYLPALRKKLIVELDFHDLIETAQIEFNCTPAVSYMEHVGFPIDTKKYEVLIEKLKVRRDARYEELQQVLNEAMGITLQTMEQGDLFGDSKRIVTGGINLNSPIQVKEAFRRLGVDLPSTGKQIVNRMVAKHPQLEYLTNYRAEQILVTTFGEKLLGCVDPKSGRIHANFWQLKPATGRFASTSPNLQQIPKTKEFRECFRPTSESRCFIICDYSQIELRILAQISGDKVMINAFNNNEDLHSITAKTAFNLDCPVEKVKTLYPEKRGLAKGLNFGVVYGIGAGKYSDNTGIPMAEAKRAIKGFYQTYPQVAKWLFEIEEFGVKNRHIRTLAGRKLQLYFDARDEAAIAMARRNARNYPIQGLSADILKTALNLIYRALMPYDAAIVNIVHDEIIVECERADAEQVGHIVSSNMISAAKKYLTDVAVEADADVGSSWADKG